MQGFSCASTAVYCSAHCHHLTWSSKLRVADCLYICHLAAIMHGLPNERSRRLLNETHGRPVQRQEYRLILFSNDKITVFLYIVGGVDGHCVAGVFKSTDNSHMDSTIPLSTAACIPCDLCGSIIGRSAVMTDSIARVWPSACAAWPATEN
jgi:hypothetical protein